MCLMVGVCARADEVALGFPQQRVHGRNCYSMDANLDLVDNGDAVELSPSSIFLTQTELLETWVCTKAS